MGVDEEFQDKARAELGDLAEAGVVMVGNAFSQVLLLKGEPEEGASDGGAAANADPTDAPPSPDASTAGASALLSGPDGKALRAALGALGYAPEDWVGLSTRDADGYPLVPGTLRLAVVTLDPSTVIALDEPAAAALREAFADELVELQSLEAATLQAGSVVQLLGMRVMALGGFEESLSNPKAKQLMWARLKQLPPLGEPY